MSYEIDYSWGKTRNEVTEVPKTKWYRKLKLP